MSTFGSPGGQQKIFKPTPPERGSFPLDHEGECKSVMATYLRCLRANKGTNSPDCRGIAKTYLQCRMERNLMAPDEMRNLGFTDDETQGAAGAAAVQKTDGQAAAPSADKKAGS
ncbi:hypothetical protein EJ06DRAFT_475165 [Trichodelitschia bisporula]|uniref:Cytochrome c oxidase assembly protein COX19 n=1 Tax=Trichodelitschia bisporula TaxID=703511 RepID=A0A6G1HZV4_9PEZI|nr:hypothetical protein EJ06DRAFT_475165 [Trichodelitschia bisporula]